MTWGVPVRGIAQEANGGNLTLAEPPGIVTGARMIAMIAYKGTAPFTLPAGWTIIGTQQSSGNTASDGTSIGSGVWAYIDRGASVPDLTFTRTGGDIAYGFIVWWPGHAPVAPTASSENTLGVGSTTVTTGTITTTTDLELLVAWVAKSRASATMTNLAAATSPTGASGATDTTTPPASEQWIERIDSNTATGSDTGIAFFDAIKASLGATGTLTGTAAASGRHVMFMAAFKQAKNVTADVGAFAIAGQDAALKVERKLAADTGAFTVAGQAAGLTVARKIVAEVGTFLIAGQDAVLKAVRGVRAAVGVFRIAGQDAGFTTPADIEPERILVVDPRRRIAVAERRRRTIAAPIRRRILAVKLRTRTIRAEISA